MILFNTWLAFVLSARCGYMAAKAKRSQKKAHEIWTIVLITLAALAFVTLFLTALLPATTGNLIICVLILFTGYMAGLAIFH